MKILSLSLERELANADSLAASKMREYAALVDAYTAIVPGKQDADFALSPKARVVVIGAKNRIWLFLRILLRASALCRSERFDLLTSQDPFELGLIAFLLKKMHGVAWQAQEHGDFFSQPYWRSESWLNRFRFFLGRFLIRRADGVRVVSERIRGNMIDNLGVDGARVVVVPVYTDFDEKLRIKNLELRIQDGELIDKSREFLFLSMGRFVKQKNLPMLVRAFARVHEKNPETRLRLVGRGPLERELRDLCTGLGVADAVEFLPWTSDVAEEYASADAYVLSSDYEGWGRVIVEAAQADLPVIMTDVGCAGELIQNEEGGLVVPPRDEQALAKAMERVLREPELGKRLANGAKAAFVSLPDKQRSLELYREGWRRLVG